MIKKQILNNPGEKTLMKKILKELKHEAEYVGEDGDMVCVAKNKEVALKKIKKKMREDVGLYDMPEMSINDIQEVCIFLVNKDDLEEKERFEDSEWYIDYKNLSDYSVFTYNS